MPSLDPNEGLAAQTRFDRSYSNTCRCCGRIRLRTVRIPDHYYGYFQWNSVCEECLANALEVIRQPMEPPSMKVAGTA